MTTPDDLAESDSDGSVPLLKELIKAALDTCNDPDLLDLVLKMLIYG